MQWFEIRITVPLSLLEPAYNFVWPYVHGLLVNRSDTSFIIQALLFSETPDHILKKLKNFLHMQERSVGSAYEASVTVPLIPSSDKFVVVPVPTPYVPPIGLPIFIQRGRAFGLGCHPCTMYCMEGLKYINDREPDTFRSGKILDAGLGTGILSIAASKLGAENITGVDINDVSIKEALENVTCNNMKSKIQIYLCSVTALDGQFDIILANLYGYFLARNASELMQLLSPKGWLILGGMAVPHDDVVIRNFTDLGLTECIRFRDEEWSAAILQKP